MAEINSLSRPQAPFVKGICAVVVLYHPDEKILCRLQDIAAQTEALVAVDNSDNRVGWKLPIGCGSKIHLIRNDENLGIAAALNQGVDWAEQKGFEFALLFDQDSKPMPGMADMLVQVYRSCRSRQHRQILLGSNYYNGLAKIQFPCRTGETWRKVKMIITSGTLLPLNVYRQVGPFREEFFIDAVDTDYCLRAANCGVEVLRVCEPLMWHAIGNLSSRRLVWKQTAVSNHTARRRYYIARNNLILVREYWQQEPKWALRKIWYLIKTFLLICLFEDGKRMKLLEFCRGVKEGVMKVKADAKK